MTLKKANQYMTENKHQVNSRYRNQYHLMAPIGWLNDPNGFCEFNGQYHQFYQHYPFDSKWGPMFWGHSVSSDFIHWEDQPIALAPDQEYDSSGVFSGSAIQIDNQLHLIYTGHLDPDGNNSRATRQVQCLATSDDGVSFHKYEQNPIISSEQIPQGASIQDFRDPKIFKIQDLYYIIVGSSTEAEEGQILFYVSEDLIKWNYLNRFTLENFGWVWECPDFFELGGYDILIVSPQKLSQRGYDFSNIHSAVAFMGHFDPITGQYTVESYQSIDSGFDLYAPQTVKLIEGRRVMTAWMNMWERTQITHEIEHGWCGSMILPRELTLKNNRIYQSPVREINSLRKQVQSLKDLPIVDTYCLEHIEVKSQELWIEIEEINNKILEIYLFDHQDERLILTIDGIAQEVILDRSNLKNKIESSNKPADYIRKQRIESMENGIKLNIFLDVSSVEIFINEGEYVMTSLVFTQEPGGISFHSKEPVVIKTIDVWDIEV